MSPVYEAVLDTVAHERILTSMLVGHEDTRGVHRHGAMWWARLSRDRVSLPLALMLVVGASACHDLVAPSPCATLHLDGDERAPVIQCPEPDGSAPVGSDAIGERSAPSAPAQPDVVESDTTSTIPNDPCRGLHDSPPSWVTQDPASAEMLAQADELLHEARSVEVVEGDDFDEELRRWTVGEFDVEVLQTYAHRPMERLTVRFRDRTVLTRRNLDGGSDSYVGRVALGAPVLRSDRMLLEDTPDLDGDGQSEFLMWELGTGNRDSAVLDVWSATGERLRHASLDVPLTAYFAEHPSRPHTLVLWTYEDDLSCMEPFACAETPTVPVPFVYRRGSWTVAGDLLARSAPSPEELSAVTEKLRRCTANEHTELGARYDGLSTAVRWALGLAYAGHAQLGWRLLDAVAEDFVVPADARRLTAARVRRGLGRRSRAYHALVEDRGAARTSGRQRSSQRRE